MFRIILGSSFAARLTLVALLTVSYAGAVLINNNLLFPWAADAPYRHWVFVPAGMQLLYVMLFGWRGVLGITFGGAAEYLSHPLGFNIPGALFVAGADALASWCAMELFSLATRIRFPWANLSWRQLPTLTFLTALISALAVFLALIASGVETSDEAFRDITLFVLGDFVGAFLFFAIVLMIRRELTKAERAEMETRED